ncbi:MAG: alpha/beta fold hydrolase [Chloroflexi bacterium]|jgi:2-succinyl-6-hydroxy-2,4-cyclohexadiene-1-carboxylate synthase|nr:alpha/beta fold hydrolase [Chloroflexota bacterium]
MTLRRLAAHGATYAVRDLGSGPAVLLLHGFTGTGASLDALALDLREAGYRTLAPDLLGHGASDAPADPARHDVARQAADIAAIVRELDAAPTAVVGYSFGGRVALRLALDAPDLVSSLVVIGSGPGIADPTERARRRTVDEDLALSIERDGVAAFVDRWEALPLFASEEALPAGVRARRREERLAQRPEGLAASIRGAGQGTQEPLVGRLGALHPPTLLVAGSIDTLAVARARAMAAAAPSGRAAVLVVDGAGHAAHLAAPGVVRAAILDHLATAAGSFGGAASDTAHPVVASPGASHGRAP